MQKPYLTEIRTVAEFVKLIEQDYPSSHLFRGQPEDKPLLPKIARGDLRPNFATHEEQLITDFKRRSAPYLDLRGFDAWDLLAVAQHHGMATRLLDWSANPLAALWFAVREDTKSDEDGVVWILPYDNDDIADQEKETPFENERTKIFQPKHITRTIVAQSGWFTVHKYINPEKEFIPLEDNKLYKRHCEKCRVPRNNFLLLRSQLDRFGVNASTMFPDLRGLSEYLNSTHIPRLIVMRFPRIDTNENQERS